MDTDGAGAEAVLPEGDGIAIATARLRLLGDGVNEGATGVAVRRRRLCVDRRWPAA